MVRSGKKTAIFTLAGMVALWVAGTAWADGSSLKGDDPVLCCQDASLRPTTTPVAGGGSGIFIFKGCQAIDAGPTAFNRCDGLVINCAETPAACVPDPKLGGKDCICGVNLNLDVLLNLTPLAGSTPTH